MRWRGLISTGALLAAVTASLVATAPPADAAFTSVGTAAQFTAAWSDNGTVAIDVIANITLTCTQGTAVRNSSLALRVDGGGHILTQGCAGKRLLEQDNIGTITLNDLVVSGGDDDTGPGGGALLSNSDVVINHSRLHFNHTQGDGGAIRMSNPSTSLRITDSSVSGNSSHYSGGAISAAGHVYLTRVTASGNTAGYNGGAVRGYDLVDVTNSTLTGNAAVGHGGAIDAGGIALLYSTIVRNSSPGGGNIFAENVTLISFGSVVAEPSFGSNCEGTSTVAASYSVSDDDSCSFKELSTPLELGGLADNGGGLLTVLPSSSSPLVDAVPAAHCEVPTGGNFDERGVRRPQGAGCDIGAVEVAATATTTTTAGSTTVANATITTAASQPAQAVNATPTFTG